MTKRLRIAREAEAELDEAIGWYEKERRGLGERFRDAVREALQQIATDPQAGARPPHVADPDVRRLLVSKFPYAIVYYEGPADVLVIAVAHGRKRPGYWLPRR